MSRCYRRPTPRAGRDFLFTTFSNRQVSCIFALAAADNERLFNPSRETTRILAKAKAIGPATGQLCQSLFDSEGRVGQRKLWGIVGLVKRYPRRLIEQACAMALHEGVRSYKQIMALTERLLAQALIDLDTPVQGELELTQNDPLIRAGRRQLSWPVFT